ncbi:MAG: glycosyltransferase [Ignavibacteria bacterium]|nr:glycosyltransferase [Ignavibacteria bacterium]
MIFTFESLLVFFTLLYFADIFWLWLGLRKCVRASENNAVDSLPSVSIVVAARNEESNILACLHSLSQIIYPRDKLEIIIVDDRSTDSTQEIISAFIKNHSEFKIVRICSEGDKIRGKANALAVALDSAQGDIFMFTDADCCVTSEWVHATINEFQNDVGIVGGYTVLRVQSTFEGIQSLDWILNFSVSAAMAGRNLPITVIGNNFSIRRNVYELVGGFRGIPFSVTEDYAMVQAVVQRTSYRVKFFLSKNTLVESYPCKTWHQLFSQKQRWAVGAMNMVPHGVFVIGIGYVTHFLMLLGIMFASPMILLCTFAVKLLSDIFFLSKPLSEFRIFSRLQYLFPFELYYIVYGFLFPFLAVFTKNVMWKERKF